MKTLIIIIIIKENLTQKFSMKTLRKKHFLIFSQ